MPKRIDLTGRVFGDLTVIKSAGHRVETPRRRVPSKRDQRDQREREHWLCRCKCGGTADAIDAWDLANDADDED